MDSRRTRLTGLLGVAGVVIPSAGVVVLPIWDFPDTGTSGAALVSWTGSHQDRLQVVMVLYTIGVTLWLAFGAALWSRLRDDLQPGSVAPACFGAGFTAMVTLLLAGFTAFDVLVYRADTIAPRDAGLLYDLTFGLLAMSGMPTAVALGAFAVAVWRDRILPVFTAVLAAVTAVAHVGLLASFVVPSGFFSLEGWVIAAVPAFLWAWILTTGGTLLGTSRR